MSLRLVHIAVLMAVQVANGSAQRFSNTDFSNSNSDIAINHHRVQHQAHLVLARQSTPVPKATTTTTPSPNLPLHLHTTRNLTLIWNNVGSAAAEACSIWRAEPTGGITNPGYPVGDIISKDLTEHSYTYLVDMPEPRSPTHYTKIWNDKGSKATSRVTIWRVNCPQGYIALGNVATTDGSEPSEGAIYCVHRKYTLLGHEADWQLVWNNRGSSATSPVAIYRAVNSTAQQQTVYGIGAVASYDGKPEAPYFLNKYFGNVDYKK